MSMSRQGWRWGAMGNLLVEGIQPWEEVSMSAPNQTTIPKDELILVIREVLPEIQPAMPRFDWKWFLNFALPLVLPFIAAGIIGYFSIKADLNIIQRDVQYTQTAVMEMKRKIDDIEKQMQRLNNSPEGFFTLQT